MAILTEVVSSVYTEGSVDGKTAGCKAWRMMAVKRSASNEVAASAMVGGGGGATGAGGAATGEAGATGDNGGATSDVYDARTRSAPR